MLLMQCPCPFILSFLKPFQRGREEEIIMTELEEFIRGNHGNNYKCIFCGAASAKRELPLNAYIQTFCPQCGRYGISCRALSEGENQKTLVSTNFKQNIKAQLQARADKEDIAMISSDTFKTGKIGRIPTK